MKKLFLLSILGLAGGCATYQSNVAPAKRALMAGDAAQAVQLLKPYVLQESKDQLIYLLDYASSLQMAGEYEESNKYFLQADRLMDELDYHSISKVAGSMLASEEMVQYKGESFERVLVNAYMALNYIMLGKMEDALVETRRLNEKLSKYQREGEHAYEENPFAHYLAGLIWESDKKYDDAYIEYKRAYELNPLMERLPTELLTLSKLSKRQDEYKKWKQEFPSSFENPAAYDKNMGELVVLVQQGWVPTKHPRPEAPRYPMLLPEYSMIQDCRVQVIEGDSRRCQMAYNVQKVAIQTLNDDYGSLVARRLGGVATKMVVADQVRQQNKLAGDLLLLGMLISDRADLRQWSFLPQTFQIVRWYLPAGTYQVQMQGLSWSGAIIEEKPVIQVEIRPGKKSIQHIRFVK